ncbi:helix-turn-helix transcriptional regulator [Sphingobacterium kitahiroshimense]|uniref:helix-turn-helix domain-containing protein n=1 Tax=Sphingobacterium sp. B16(2022) TaxID=2914044 RepID=UPI00143A37D8|nr:helix-turn-helix transcriptional regulator [Sphingobacterium sp. B16(2022)]NJI71957.1 helix-turn-helix transcriptional regulator [Sphingobacterium sp. B16(2022)]
MNTFTLIIEYEISHLDYLFIQHIKSLRDKKGWSQKELSEKMGVTSSFVGNVENLNERHKYSVRHIALLSKAFNYKSPSRLFDFPSPEYDEVKLRVKVTKENYTSIKDGKEIKKSRVISSELLDIIPTKDFIT